MSDRKIRAMYKRYGRSTRTETCGSCCNLVAYDWRSRRYYKCVLYGESHSEATDWAKRWEACGRFGEPFRPGKELAVLDVLKRASRVPDGPVPGQVGMWNT